MREYRHWLRQDLMSALPKGGILGLVGFGLFFGLRPHWDAIWNDWHWAMILVIMVAVRLLIGAETTWLLVLVTVCTMGIATANNHLVVLLLSLVAGAIIRVGSELFYRRV